MPRRKRQRGEIEKLPSGALRVRVYAGIDPITKRRFHLTETIKPGPSALKEAERARVRLVNQINERRNPRSRATVNQLFDRFLETHNIDPRTRKRYTGNLDKHIRPLMGAQSASRITPEVLESFYAELRRCRDHCDGKKFVQHRTSRPHECDEHVGPACRPAKPRSCKACKRMCQPHRCRPLAERTILKIHWSLSAAFEAGVRWDWISVNPCRSALKPGNPPVNPDPPSPTDAARIVREAARRDPDWGALIWTKMNTGTRRGELCALRWNRIDFATRVVEIKRAIGEDPFGNLVEKDTKTHQQRRVVIDDETVAVLRAHHQRCSQRAFALGRELPEDAYVFSNVPDGSTFITPDSVTQRYKKMVDRMGIDTTIGRLRHYSATELLSAGVDLRAVAGRLGHSGGGSTTLRVYAAWTSEADQRAAAALTARGHEAPPELLGQLTQPGAEMTVRPIDLHGSPEAAHAEEGWSPDQPYRQIAADLCAAITCGALREGSELPSEESIAERYAVARSTAHRALAILRDLGMTEVSRGQRARVSAAGWDATRTTYSSTRTKPKT